MSLVDFLNSIRGAASGAQTSMGQLGDTSANAMAKATDGAKSAAEAQDALAKQTQQAAQAQREAAQAQSTFNASIVPAISSTMSSVSSMNSYQSSLNSVKNAQMAYNSAVQKYGEDSEQAARALNSLQNAENSSASARNAMIMSLINTTVNVGRAVQAFSAMRTAQQAAGAASIQFGSSLTMAATAGGALLFVMLAMQAGSDRMRIAFSALAGVMAGLTAAQWAYNAAKAAGLALTGVGLALVAAAGVAAAGVAAMGTYYLTKSSSESSLAGNVGALSENIAAMEKGDINVYIQVDKLTADSTQLDEIARKVQESLTARCQAYGTR